MSMIKVEELTFAYPGTFENVFENVSFLIDTDWKLGLVGRNGRGKTTFLKLLQGEYEYKGKIRANVPFVYFPYTVRDSTRLTSEIVWEICVEAEDWEVVREFSLLGLDSEVLWRPFDSLSNGERTKALLAALFLSDGKFLLIDEPTNHLDAASRAVVARYLHSKKGFILVSHDREFLDGSVDHILSLNKTEVRIQSGNFSTFSENFEREQDFERKQNERLKKDVARLSEAAKRAENWSDKAEAGKYGVRNAGLRVDRGYVGHKAAKMMQSAKNTEKRREKAIEEKSALLKNVEYSPDLKLSPLVYRSERLVNFDGVTVRYDGREIHAPVSFAVERGERVFLDGGNGTGKSSLLKLLVGEGIEHTGTVATGSGLILSYVSQDTSKLKGSLGEYARAYGIDESLFKAILHKTGFNKSQFGKDISEFSDGQKKKVTIARSLCEQAHLYVWDEPLNFVDVYSRIQIERLIAEFAPTMLLVEHDVAFRRKIATKIISL